MRWRKGSKENLYKNVNTCIIFIMQNVVDSLRSELIDIIICYVMNGSLFFIGVSYYEKAKVNNEKCCGEERTYQSLLLYERKEIAIATKMQ